MRGEPAKLSDSWRVFRGATVDRCAGPSGLLGWFSSAKLEEIRDRIPFYDVVQERGYADVLDGEE